MIFRILLIWAALSIAPVIAAEKINRYDVDIAVEKDGDILVKETIKLRSEGRKIRRGIFRDLPRLYEKDGVNLPFRYNLKSITRDGKKEPYDVSRINNAVRWRIGDADAFLKNGPHTYEITYSVKNQIRYRETEDELYWNAIGQYWDFPIDRAHVTITLPNGAIATDAIAYTGRYGTNTGTYQYSQSGARHIFSARGLDEREGMTVSLSIAKGVVDPPSGGDRRAEWWALNNAIVILVSAALGLGVFHYLAWKKVGIDPRKGPVFPRYEPPKGYSPAGVHHIYHRRLSGHAALIASIVNLAINKKIHIDSPSKKSTTLTRLDGANADEDVFPVERFLLKKLLPHGGSKEIGGKTDMAFTKSYQDFQSRVTKKFGKEYFRWNFGYIAVSLVLSVGAIFIAAFIAASWSAWHTAAVLALILINLLFAYLLPAATQKGQEIRTAIEGFRLYLDKAEKLQLNATEIGNDAPPPMTTERYERFLPYAIALGVEKPWTKHFEKTLPREAESYEPGWANVSGRNFHSLHGLNSALVSSMSSGVQSAMPQSSSSSGSGGGGFSGGGGGGGGGGGW